MYDFLENFHQRMQKLSYSYLIDYKACTLIGYRNHFNDLELINITYTLLVYILEQSLKDEEATIKDMSNFLEEIIFNYYNKKLAENDIYDITKTIVYKVLRNDGKPFEFRTINYKTKEEVVYQFNLVNQKPSMNDYTKSTFYLEKEGYRLILGSLEIDERTQIDLNQMILELSLKKKNYAQGVYAVNQLYNLISAQINILVQFIYKTRENIFQINHEDFEENYLRNLSVIEEQNDKFEDLKQIIVKEENRLYEAVNLDELNLDSLKQLNKIKEQLSKITSKSTKLISMHFDFKSEYIKCLEDSALYYTNKRLNLKDDIIRPIDENLNNLDVFNKIYNPLFFNKIAKSFNINTIFNEQTLAMRLESDEEVTLEEIKDDDNYKEEIKIKKQFKVSLKELINYIVKTGNCDLSTIIDYYQLKTDKEYKKLVPTVRIFGEILIELLKLGEIDLEELTNEVDNVYFSEDIVFDLKKELLEELKNQHFIGSLKKINFYKDTNLKIEIKERSSSDFSYNEVLVCPNIIIETE